MDRRKFIQLSGYTIVGSGLFVLPHSSYAFFPWVARFLFRGLGRRAVARSATRAATRSAAATTARRSTFKSIVGLSVISGSIISVSPNLHASINKYNAKTIWINNGIQNNFFLSLKNNSNERKSAQLYYELRDIDSGRTEIEKPCGLLSVAPNERFKFSFSISDLPYLGAKKLYARSDSKDLDTQPSEPIIVTAESEVIFKRNA